MFNLVENVNVFAASSATISAEKKTEIDGYGASVIEPLQLEVQVRVEYGDFHVVAIEAEEKINAKDFDGAQDRIDDAKDMLAAVKGAVERSTATLPQEVLNLLTDQENEIAELQRKLDEEKAKPAPAPTPLPDPEP